MGGCRCSYKNCRNTTKTTENIHFFHYPVKHKERCMRWIENANKPKFYELEEEQLRNKVICEVHFEDRWFPNSQKKRLIQGAVPTLDGECEEEISASEQPVYLAHRSSDVQVLPANDDATVFVLDTENMFNSSKKVESYVYKNGILLPCNTQVQPKPRTLNRVLNSKPSTSHPQFSGMEYEANSTRYVEDVSKVEEDAEYKEVVVKKEMDDSQKTAEEGYNVYPGSSGMMSQSGSGIDSVQAQNRRSDGVKPSRGLVNRTYLRKIKQHSRDIATIKRLLRQKMEADRDRPLDVRTALTMLQQHVPASLYTIVSLLLGEKNELNDDDIEFFTTVHRTSPEVYQLLSDKYKWNLPSVDIVDMPSE